MSYEIESLMTMSSFEALYVLREYRDKYVEYSDQELIKMLKRYPDKCSLDYRQALKLEGVINIEYTIGFSAALREALKQIILQKRPSWMYAITFGRKDVLNNLADLPNIRQCFKSAHLFDDEPDQMTIEWWDELSQLIRAEKDAKKVQIGREGEKLSYDYEKKRLLHLNIQESPKWIALDDSTVGYDIKSYNPSPYGVINKLIEVKSCSTDNIAIYLTRNEWEQALKFQDNYFFHIWHLPTNTLKYELSTKDMESYILQNREKSEWQILKITF